MNRSLTVEFTKMHGAGNDFIVLDNRWYRFSDEELSDLAAAWCPRRYGIGADGLLALAPTDAEAVAYRMRYVNGDGSWATMCGNGARCLARFAAEAGLEGPEFTFESDAGRYRAEVPPGDQAPVRLHVPAPTRLTADPGMETDRPGGLDAVHFVHTGTEHLVAFVSEVEAVPVVAWGRKLRYDPALQPAGANVNFVAVTGEGLRVRTYEKGVEGETPSCGTGVLAAATVAVAAGHTSPGRVDVRTPGGRLHVGVPEAGDAAPRYLEGPVRTTFRGTIEVG
ncbi:MAG: diaminopimelate epimerase [Salinibacter sp.]